MPVLESWGHNYGGGKEALSFTTGPLDAAKNGVRGARLLHTLD